MKDTEIEKIIRKAGYDIQWDDVPGHEVRWVYALRDGKRHTRSQPTLLALAEHLGRVERPVRFVEDRDALEAVMARHAEERSHFLVRTGSCRVALFKQCKYVQLVSVLGRSRAMYELQAGGIRRTSKGNLPTEVVAAFASEDA
jgi:hypothetical protein